MSRAAKLMTPKPQQQTLSVRISEPLRLRLERAKQLMAARTGRPVSTSEIAKQLLESAREDRLEVVNLLVDATDTLVQIRRKADAQKPLSRAEWAVLAHFVQHGVEAFSSHTPNPVSRDALLTILDAFLAVYNLLIEGTSQWDAVYVGNLPSECCPATPRRGSRSESATPTVVRRMVVETRRRVSDPTHDATLCAPLMAGRNLSVLLEDERLPGAHAVDRALRPYGPRLWSLAARGHYVVTRSPICARFNHGDAVGQATIPSITEANFTLSFDRGDGHDFAVLLSFPGALGPTYPVRGYPAITEFRAMLAALAADGPTRRWSGAYFAGGVTNPEEKKNTECWFRAQDNGITFRVSEEDWQSVHALVNRAWEMPDIRTAWDALALEYGEL